MTDYVLKHDSIGSITGNAVNDHVVQFLGVRYATLKNRFALPDIKEYKNLNGVIDGTKLGPTTLSRPSGAAIEFALVQHSLEYDEKQHTISDIEGLNLNITAPTSALQSSSNKVAVFVYIHGGGFMEGTGNSPLYNFARLVSLSVAVGNPMICVTMNYRVGIAGLLNSSEMRAAGLKANNAIRDQRTALEWIQRHISGFGGDPSRITVGGQSAGAASVCFHLMSPQPLFKRAVVMGGSGLMMPPVPPSVAEGVYERAVGALGLQDETSEERIHQLLTMPGPELREKCAKAGIPGFLMVDDDIFDTTFTIEEIATKMVKIPGANWCEAVLLGDCQFDGNIHELRLRGRTKGVAKAVYTSIAETFAEQQKVAEKLQAAYSLTSDEQQDELKGLTKVLRMASDLRFHAPTLAYAEALSGHMPFYMYRFNEPMPWSGKWKGEAIHFQETCWLFQNFNEFLDQPQKEQAEAFGTLLVRFVNGGACWEPWSVEHKTAMIIDQGRLELKTDLPPHNGRRQAIHDLANEVGWDSLYAAFNRFSGSTPAQTG